MLDMCIYIYIYFLFHLCFAQILRIRFHDILLYYVNTMFWYRTFQKIRSHLWLKTTTEGFAKDEAS